MTRKHVLLLVASVVGAVVIVVVGRAGREHEQAYERNGIAEVRAAIGPSLTNPGPTDYTPNPDRTCLMWEANGLIYALELCIDDQGRVIEAVDRRGVTPKFYRLQEEPGAARLRIDPKLFSRLVNKL